MYIYNIGNHSESSLAGIFMTKCLSVSPQSEEDGKVTTKCYELRNLEISWLYR